MPDAKATYLLSQGMGTCGLRHGNYATNNFVTVGCMVETSTPGKNGDHAYPCNTIHALHALHALHAFLATQVAGTKHEESTGNNQNIPKIK